MDNNFDCLIVGGGIVGLATAFNILESKPELKVAVLEKDDRVAKHQTGNNSGVIHSGVYYKPGSLKALNCIRGYEMLLDFANKHNIPYDLCGKVIVATRTEELPLLENVYKRGIENGLTKIRKITAEEIRGYEPHCTGLAGIHVPYTGIIDYGRVAEVIGEQIALKGGRVILNAKVDAITSTDKGAEVHAAGRTYTTRLVVNCAGLFSDRIAELTEKNLDVRIVPFRGEYYELRDDKRHLVKSLIYPVPDPNFPFLGVHFTKMIGGGVEAGPNAVFAFKREGYKKSDVNLSDVWDSLSWPGFRKVAFKYWKTGLGEYYRSFSKAAFTKALQKLVPEVQENDLVPAGAGVRAQACDRTGGLLDDFKITENKIAINVLNAPSPAATSSLSIGKTVGELVLKRF
ncbi:MAG: L-2-hydroxyglutarate oxidase [Bacteroidia bacterium]|jgi:L-2-hydroxyglutarate oxidase